MSLRISRRPAALVTAVIALLLLALGTSFPAAAQGGSGTIEGVARGAEGSAPLPFSLIRLLPVAQPAAAQTVLTDAQGRFRFDGVPAGDYRLRLERVGYQRTLSGVVSVQPGATLRQEIRSAAEPIRLAGLVVGGRCLGAAELAEDPRVLALWTEAQKGVETRKAFERQYRFTEITRQEVEMHWRIRGTRSELRVDTLVSHPDSVTVREQRRRARFESQGYSRGGMMTLPNEKELFDREFLRDHCLETTVDEQDGAFALRFRPIRTVRGRREIQGAIWIDAGTYLTRRLEFEYLDGDRVIADLSVDYADVAMAGSRMRMRSRGRGELRSGGVQRVLFHGAEADITFAYQDVEQVAGR